MDSWQFLSDGPIGFHAIGGPDDLPTTHLFSPFSLAQQKHLQQGQSHSTADPISSSPSSASPKPTASRAPPKPYTLIFAYCYQDEHGEITEQPHLLLGFKMRGFGAGHINGFGGKPLKMASLNEAATEPVSESPQDCVVRELEEETGISGKQVRDRLRWHGHLLIHAQDKESTSKFANEHALLSVFSARLSKATLETAER
ncbi:Nudix (Nucleoside diphosphate linked moiety X)-type motif 1 [Tilletia horrida]|uniref:Nudix (Nucleoside diphosphate linked moiety X)-type motif 1 n=1 Tax=Tilletia horrida TaxID=155126 RepID=A0AAN6JSC1_9BASI|nr:Nudix (Nucleoside diphosphate linked moiety X)-type motif 1 [Tilletia horrida]